MNSLKELPQFYSPRGICCQADWGGGGGGASAIESAGQQEQLAALQAASAQQQYLNQALGMLQPYSQFGRTSMGALGSLWGLPGYGGGDPSKQLEATPGYQFLLRQAIGGSDYTGGLGRYAASTGQTVSGNALKSATDRAQQMGLSYALQPYIQSLQFGAGLGGQAAGQGAGLTVGTGAQIGQDYMAAAQANAQAQVQAANARAAQGNIWGDILGLGGMVGGMALGMPGVGSSIGNMISGAINNWGYQGTGSIPSKQEGGPISGPALVGEDGPEIFVPDRPGYIVPNHLLPYYRRSFGRF